MRRIIMNKLFLLLSLLTISVFGQSGEVPKDPKAARLESIYRNLEYNTTSFNDLKQKWIVTDPVFVREIFNRFVVKNALRINGRKPTLNQLEQYAYHIYAGNVFIDLRRRYYDDELELIRFFKEERAASSDSSDYFFDGITDFVFIKDILGDELYVDLKKQIYAYNDITKSYFDNKPAYNFDIYLHLTEPEVMFWSATTNNRNKYLVSFIGRWGNDHISLPGWYASDYIFGLKLNYVDSLINNRPAKTYIGEFGIGIPTVQPDLGFDPEFTGRRLWHSGSSFYFKFIGSPLGLIWEPLSDIELNATGYFSLGENRSTDFKIPTITKFYSQRNYFDLFFRKNDLTTFSDLGAVFVGGGFSAFDVKYFGLNPAIPTLSLEKSTEGNGFKYGVSAEAGVKNDGGLLSHMLGMMLNYNITEGLGYFGFKLNFMITNSVGFDFKVMSALQFSDSGLPKYRSESYVVFSPVIKINY